MHLGPKEGVQVMRAFLRRFFSDPKGNVAILFAIAVVPIIGAMGAAVDYSMASAQRVNLQAAIDATGLALAKIMPASQTELEARGKEWFLANLGQTPLTNVTLTISGTTGKLNIEAHGYYQPEIVSVLGAVSFPVGASTEIKWGSTRLRVALVLDVTGSMSSAGKMPAMQTAAKNLINQLKGVATVNGDVYVSIVPFAKDVAVATSNYTANWVRWDDWDAVNGTCSISGYTSEAPARAGRSRLARSRNIRRRPSARTTAGLGCRPTASGLPRPTAPGTAASPTVTRIPWGPPITTPRIRRQNPLIPGTLFPAEQYCSCPETVMGLSYDWTALTNKINALSPAGNTNQAIGLAWGWQTLTNAPFTIPAFDPAFKYKQVIILLSDGLNTQDRWYTSAASIDARQAITCSNVKATGVIVYTVQVNTNGDPTSTVLKNCATDASKFFMLTSGSQIITTFQQIATELANMHLSQ